MPKAVADGIPVWCSHDKIVDIVELIPNPKNPNHHPETQIDLGARIIKAHGWRWPIAVSTRSGFITKGHGRLLFAQKLGVKEVPVDYQDYDNEAAEWQDVIADNRLQEFAEPDRNLIREIIANNIDAINIELTGYRPELLKEGVSIDPVAEWEGMPDFAQEEKLGVKTLIVHFETMEAYAEFAGLIGQSITEKTKFIWHPKKENEPFGVCSIDDDS